MAQTVSNDALWEKLKEMDKKIDKLSETQESPVSNREQSEITPNLKEVKEEITTEIKVQASLLGKHNDINFEANKKIIQMLNGNILNTLEEVTQIRNRQSESVELQKPNDSYFNFKFFKVRKTSFVIAILGLLVFTLTLFCMKQQNDYTLLMNEYHKQNVTIQKLNEELKIFEEKYPDKQQKNGVNKNKIQKIHD